MATAFTGQLNTNEIFSALYNMIINIQTYADPIQESYSSLVDAARIEGGAYGDTVLKISTDALKSVPWGNDAEATNLLKLHRPPAPKVEKITLNVFRQIAVTVDEYLTKRGFTGLYSFSEFNSVILAWLSTTKRVYETTLYNVFVGTETSSSSASAAIQAAQNRTVTLTNRDSLTSPSELEAASRADAMAIGEHMANLMVDLRDSLRLFNDYGFLRAYSPSGLKVIWNAAAFNKIRRVDLPTIFHKDGILEDIDQEVLPSRYFGTRTSAAVAAASNDGTYRAVYEEDYATAANAAVTHVFPGDLIPASTSLVTALNDNGTAYSVDASGVPAGHAYVVDPTILFKIVSKEDIPLMSAWEAGSSFWNAAALVTTQFITWGHNTLVHLSEFPLITVKGVEAQAPAEGGGGEGGGGEGGGGSGT